ncbi:MAG: putative membrane protein [Ilumatobacter sp.]|jgi:uncharacterized membrane protein
MTDRVAPSTDQDLVGTDVSPQVAPNEMVDIAEPGHEAGEHNEVRAGRSLSERIRSLTWAQGLLLVVLVFYISYFTQLSLTRHHGLAYSSYDSALYDQGVWLLSRGEAPFVTLMGRNLFGDHSSFVLLFLVPFYWIWPAAGVLFFAQSAAIGLGAVPVFLYGRKRLGSEWPAVVLASCYLLHPAVGGTNLENFHPDAFLGVFVGFAIWAALERRWKTYVACVVLALMVKEDASLVLVPLGVWVGVRRDWRIGVATVFGSLAFMAFAMFVVMRGLIGVPTRNGWRIPFGGPRGVITAAVTNPTDVISYFRSEGRPWYLVQMTAPFAWLFARAPSVALISGLVLFTNVLSTFWYQFQVDYHYSLVAVPALAIGTVHAIGVLRDRWTWPSDESSTPVVIPVRSAAVALVAAMAVVTSYLWSPVPWGRTEVFVGNPSNAWASAADDIIEVLPSDAVVAAHYRITPHVAHRTEIYQFPTPFRSVLYGSDGLIDGPRILDRAERVEYVVLPVPGAGPTSYPELDWAVVAPAFDLIAENDFWRVYQRDFERPIPEPLLEAPGG